MLFFCGAMLCSICFKWFLEMKKEAQEVEEPETAGTPSTRPGSSTATLSPSSGASSSAMGASSDASGASSSPEGASTSGPGRNKRHGKARA